PGYDGFVLGAHQQVHDIEAFRPEHFDRWYGLWVEAVDRGWQGPNAERAKAHAARIAAVLARRLVGIDWAPPVPTSRIDEPSAPDGPGGDRRPAATTRVGPPLTVTAGPPTPARPARDRSTTSGSDQHACGDHGRGGRGGRTRVVVAAPQRQAEHDQHRHQDAEHEHER
ncbi:MAG TPA: hypothetical protein VJN29_09765, partial [Intrasporangium sp.]